MKKSSNTPANRLPTGCSFVRKLKDGKNLYRLRYTVAGRTYSRYETITDDGIKQTETVLAKKMESFKKAVASGAYEHAEISPKSTFQDACKHFLDIQEAIGKKRESTLSCYRSAIKCHFLPSFGNVPLEKVSSLRLSAFFADLAQQGLKPSTQKIIRACLSGIFGFFVDQNILSENPVAKAASAATDDGYSPAVRFLDEKQVLAFADALNSVTARADYKMGIEIALRTGMRRGEVMGLMWNDIDFSGNLIHVSHNAVKSRDGLFVIGKVKTKRSNRVIPLPPGLKSALLCHKTAQEEYARSLGSAWDGSLGLVCTSPTGNIMSAPGLDFVFRKIHKLRPDLPKVTMHSMRHSFATLMLFRGYSIIDVAAQLGDTVAVCQSVYCHALKETACSMSVTIDSILAPAVFLRP
jgi:integrase